MTTAPVQVMPAQKKTIQIDPALLDVVYQVLLKTDLKAEQEEYDASLKDAQHVFGNGKNSLWYYQHRAQQCANKKYTTEDQKIAGCLGTDTLNQCSTKLFNKCFSQHKNDPFLTFRKKMLEAADRQDKAQKAYTGKLKLIPEPK